MRCLSLLNKARISNLALALSLLIVAEIAHGADQSDIQALFQAIDARLTLMEDVAVFKAQNHLAIEDLAREEVVLADTKTLAERHGLDADSMEQFFLAQINAAKVIQYRRRAELLNQDLPQDAIDLQAVIRPELDRLGNEIIAHFDTLLRSEASLEESDRDAFFLTIRNRLLADPEKEALFDAMLKVRHGKL